MIERPFNRANLGIFVRYALFQFASEIFRVSKMLSSIKLLCVHLAAALYLLFSGTAV